MQRYTMVFITINALHVSRGSSAHHQELKTVYTASGTVEFFLLLTSIVGELELTIHDSGKNKKNLDSTRCCVYSFELLMMGGGTA